MLTSILLATMLAIQPPVGDFGDLPPIPAPPQQPSLAETTWPPGNYGGLAVATGSLWVGSNLKVDAWWWALGFDGVHVRGTDPQGRSTVFQATDYDSTFICGRNTGYLKISNCTIKSPDYLGNMKAIFMGPDCANKADKLPLTLHLVNCKIEGVLGQGTNRPTWGLFLNQCDLIVEDCDIYWKEGTEHASYVHAFNEYGAWIINSRIHGVGAEGWKFTQRPMSYPVDYYPDQAKQDRAEANGHALYDGYHPTPGAVVVLAHSSVTDWCQDWSWRGGAGLTFQGAAADVYIVDCAFYDYAGTPTCPEWKPPMGLDDSGIEHFGDDDAYSPPDPDSWMDAGEDPANGHVYIVDSYFGAGPGPTSFKGLITVSQLDALYPTAVVCRSITIERCGFYGTNMDVRIDHIPSVNIWGCNTPAVDAKWDAWIGPGGASEGLPTTPEAMLSVNGSNHIPISQGWTTP
jgi:hypothetical protein